MSCQPKQKLDVQGHRGCRGLLPENSLPAFEKAINLGVTTLELDIAITKDNQVVVSHEPFISRFTCLKVNGDTITASEDMVYNLYDMSHAEIKQFDCGTKFHPDYPNQKKVKVYKPLLSEVFDLVKRKNSDVKFNIEIKSKPQYYGIYTPQPKDYVSIVLNEIKHSGLSSKINLQSFDLAILKEIRKQSLTMPVALLVDNNENISEKLSQLSYSPQIVSPYFKLLDAKTVKQLQSQGFKVIPWTVNSVLDLQSMLSLNVDGIITDYPDVVLGLME